MEKKEIDVKFIVGIVILLVIFGVVGGSFWNLVARQAQKDKQEEARLENEAIRAIYVEAGDILKEMYPGITKMKRNGRASLEELQPYLEIANELLCGDSEEEDKK